MADKNKLILLGGGGHSAVLIELIRLTKRYKIAGIVDPNIKKNSKVLGVSILGDDSLLSGLYREGVKNACIAVGSTRDNRLRKKIFEEAKEIGFRVPFLVHPSALLAKGVKLFEGVQIMAGAILQPGVSISENSIINTGAIVEHDCVIGQHVHICPGAVISGGCNIDDGVFVGAGATVKHSIKIGKDSIVACGAVVVKDIPAGVTVKGVPAK